MRIAVVATAICLSIVGLADARDAKAAMRMPTNIPAQGLGPALKAFARSRDLQVLYFSQMVRDVHTAGASGQLTADEALTQLLSGTGLVFRYIDANAVTILPAAPGGGALPRNSDDPDGPNSSKEGKTPSSGDSRVAQAMSEGLQEVVVTAQRREENLQDVPIGVTVVSGTDLQQANFRDLTDLQFLAPSLKFDPNNGGGFQIRGVGTQAFDFSAEQAVSTVLDDVVMDAQRGLGLFGLDDVEQIEVLRGPQGTLFGKNSTSGVVAITTRKPSLGVFSADGSVSYGERNDYNAHSSLNLPIGSTAALRIFGFVQGQDGYGSYTDLGSHLGTTREQGTRAKLLFAPNDDLDVTLTGSYAHHTDNNTILLITGTPDVEARAAAAGTIAGPRNFNNAGSYAAFNESNDAGASLNVNYRVADHTITSVTAFHYFGDRGNGPVAFFPGDQFLPSNIIDLQTHKFSEELRIASALGGLFEYVAGLFYNELELYSTQFQVGALGQSLPPGVFLSVTGAANGPPGNDLAIFDNDNRGAAIFGQVKVNFSEKVDVIAGARFTHDRNAAQVSYGFGNLPPPVAFVIPIGTAAVPSAGVVTANNLSYRISPQYHFTPDTTVYVTYSTGYKGPGVAFVSGVYDPYRRETVGSAEIGLKSELLDRHLRLNVDVFDEYYRNFQAQLLVPIPGSPLNAIVTGNAGSVRSRGFESDAAFRATQSLTFNGALTWNEAYFSNYVSGPNVYTGQPLSNAPRWSGTLAANYSRPLVGNFNFAANVNYAYRSRSYGNVGQIDTTQIGGYGFMGGRLSFGNDHWTAGVYGRNLLDHYFPIGFSPPLPDEPAAQAYNVNGRRTVGVFVTANF